MQHRIRWAENVAAKDEAEASKKSGGVFKRVRQMLSGLGKSEKKKQRRARSLPPKRHFVDSTGRTSEEAYNFMKNFDNYVAPPPPPTPIVRQESLCSLESSGFGDAKSLSSTHWMSSVVSKGPSVVETPVDSPHASVVFERPSRPRHVNDTNNNGGRRRNGPRRAQLRCQSCGANFRDSQVFQLLENSPSPVRSGHSFVMEASARLEGWQLEMAANEAAEEERRRLRRWYPPSRSSTSGFSLTSVDSMADAPRRGRSPFTSFATAMSGAPALEPPGSPIGFVRRSRTPVYANGYVGLRAPPPTRTPPKPPMF